MALVVCLRTSYSILVNASSNAAERVDSRARSFKVDFTFKASLGRSGPDDTFSLDLGDIASKEEEKWDFMPGLANFIEASACFSHSKLLQQTIQELPEKKKSKGREEEHL